MKLRINLNNLSEWLFVIYIYIFSLLKPIITGNDYSTAILLMATAIIVTIYFFYEHYSTEIISNTDIFIIIVSIIGMLIILDWLVRNNDYQLNILYNFIINAVIPLFLLKNVKNYNCVLKAFGILAIITGVLYLPDPMYSYKWSGEYMTFGFMVMLPAFCGAIILFLRFKSKFSGVISVIFFLELVMFANKSSILCGGIFFIIAYITSGKSTNSKLVKIIIIAVTTIIAFFLKENLFNIAAKMLIKTGATSYSLTTINFLLKGNINEIIRPRLLLWEKAVQVYKNHVLLGSGIGYLESTMGYAHNVALDILASGGIVMGCVVGIIFIKSIKKLFQINNRDRQFFAITMLIFWIIPLQFSLSFWNMSFFWIYWGTCFYRLNKRQ